MVFTSTLELIWCILRYILVLHMLEAGRLQYKNAHQKEKILPLKETQIKLYW